jgi:hypothetical protein
VNPVSGANSEIGTHYRAATHRSQGTVMNLSHIFRRPAGALAGLACALLASVAATPAALADPRPLPPGWNKHPPLPAGPQPTFRLPPGWNKHPPLPAPAHLHAAVAAGLPGWQITLIAIVLAAAAVALLLSRMPAARRRTPSRAA